jgi:hypothetical protein
MLDLDPDQMNADPQPWSQVKLLLREAQIGRMSPQVEYVSGMVWKHKAVGIMESKFLFSDFIVITGLVCSVADPKLLFRIRFRIRIRPLVSFGFGSGFGSGFESWIRIRIQILDLNPDQKQAKTSSS